MGKGALMIGETTCDLGSIMGKESAQHGVWKSGRGQACSDSP